MIPDCSTSIGSTHAVCQDYARCGEGQDGPYVLLSDGCSSSHDTDIGARLLVLAAEKYVNWGYKVSMHDYPKAVIEEAYSHAKRIGLQETCLDATLMAVRMIDGSLVATVYGDGMIAQRIRGNIFVSEVSYPDGYPNYMSYMLNEDRSQATKALRSPRILSFEIRPDGMTSETGDIEMGCDFYYKYVDSEADFVALISDGATSFIKPVVSETSKKAENVPLHEVLRGLLAFKSLPQHGDRSNLQTGFVRRRMQKFLKESSKNGWQHYDDLSVGAVAL